MLKFYLIDGIHIQNILFQQKVHHYIMTNCTMEYIPSILYILH